MKTSVKTDVDSVDGRRPRSTVNQTVVFYWSTSISSKPQSGRRRLVENISLVGVNHENISLVDGQRPRC